MLLLFLVGVVGVMVVVITLLTYIHLTFICANICNLKILQQITLQKGFTYKSYAKVCANCTN